MTLGKVQVWLEIWAWSEVPACACACVKYSNPGIPKQFQQEKDGKIITYVHDY